MTGMHTAVSGGAWRPSRRVDQSSPEGIDAATDVCLARERLAALSRLSERAAACAGRAEFALVDALSDRRAGAAGIEAARRRLLDAQDAALEAFSRAQDAARAVTVLTRSLGGLPPDELEFADLLADVTAPF